MKYIKIKDLEIPIDIKSYKNPKSIKFYFKGNTLEVTKPKRLSMIALMDILKQEEEKFKPSKRNWSLIINEMDSILTDKIKEKL